MAEATTVAAAASVVEGCNGGAAKASKVAIAVSIAAARGASNEAFDSSQEAP